MNNAAGADRAIQVREIDNELGQLAQLLSEAAVSLDNLEKRLAPVIKISPPAPKDPNQMPEPSRCPLAMTLRDFTRRISTMGDRIISIERDVQL